MLSLKQHKSHKFNWRVIYTGRSFFKRRTLEGLVTQQKYPTLTNKSIVKLQTYYQREQLEQKFIKYAWSEQISLIFLSKTWGEKVTLLYFILTDDPQHKHKEKQQQNRCQVLQDGCR